MPIKHNNEEETPSLNQMSGPTLSMPNPDPTLRTMQLVEKAIDALRRELDIRHNGIEDHFESMNRAAQLQHDDYVRVPTILDKAIASLHDLITAVIAREVAQLKGTIEKLDAETVEKFMGINNQFLERDTRTDQRAGDTKLAVDAAFAAAKEATAKIEASFTKQIDSQQNIIDTKTVNLDARIGDLKDRITAIEAMKGGAQEQKAGSITNIGLIISSVVAGVAVLGLIFSLIVGVVGSKNNSRNDGGFSSYELRQLIDANTQRIDRAAPQIK